jgi:hypothetical protein
MSPQRKIGAKKMADKTSHQMLTEGDPYYAQAPKPTPPRRGAAYGSFVELINDKDLVAHPSESPIANSPHISEMREAFARDGERQTEHERVVREVLALDNDAPDGFATLLYSYPWLATHLLPVFLKANTDAEG